MPSDYFDILPIHPQPKYLESSSSYVTRVAQVNGILSMNGLFALLTLGRNLKTEGGFFTDLPPTSPRALSAIAACSDARLLGTTFYYLLKKFNRPPLPQPASRFLSGSIAQRLRYCPLCLLEFGYYSLCWRFSVLVGCIHHSCQLLEKCGHCGQVIPLALLSLKLGSCPKCKSDLRSCTAPLLTVAEQRNASKWHQELEFLLMPHPCDMAGDRVLQLLGKQLEGLRKARGESRRDVARTIQEPLYGLANIESGDALSYGATFQIYIKYAIHLQTTLSSLVGVGVTEESLTAGKEERKSIRASHSIITLDEDELLTRVREAAESIKRRGERVTKRSIARLLQTYPWVLNRFEHIRRFLEQAAEHPMQNSSNLSEAELLSKVRSSIDHLKLEGIPISQRAVARASSINPEVLRHCTAARAIIEQAIEQCRAMRLAQREDELISHMQEALQALCSQGKAVTRTAVSREIHQTLDTLKHYPRALTFLNQLVPTVSGVQKRGEDGYWSNYVQREAHNETKLAFQQREGDLIRQISVAVEDLQLQKMRVTQEAVARQLKVTRGALKYYPRARVHLEQAVKDAQEKHFDRREEELLIRIESAVRQLETQGRSVTVALIAELLHMPEATLGYYPRARAAVKQILNERAEGRARLQATRLADLVKSAMQQLESSGEPVNFLTVSELTGISMRVLRRNDQLRGMIKEVQKIPNRNLKAFPLA